MKSKRKYINTISIFIYAYLTPSIVSSQIWKYKDEDNGITLYSNIKPDKKAVMILDGAEDTNTSDRQKNIYIEDNFQKTINIIKKKPEYHYINDHILKISSRHSIDYNLVKAIAVAESAYDTSAVSNKGAIGLMQIMPDTARRYGLKAENQNSLIYQLKQPEINIDIGVRYLADLIRIYPGRLDLVLSAYNAGEGAVSKAGINIPNYPETRLYINKVNSLLSILKR